MQGSVLLYFFYGDLTIDVTFVVVTFFSAQHFKIYFFETLILGPTPLLEGTDFAKTCFTPTPIKVEKNVGMGPQKKQQKKRQELMEQHY